MLPGQWGRKGRRAGGRGHFGGPSPGFGQVLGVLVVPTVLLAAPSCRAPMEASGAARPAVLSLSPDLERIQPLETAPNWSGYGTTPGPFVAAAGAFQVPRLGPGAKCSAQLSLWVGVDGMREQPGAASVIQAGVTLAAIDPVTGRCSTRAPDVYAWWEIVPGPPKRIEGLDVHPGDQIYVSLARQSAGRWRIEVVNRTGGGRFEIVRPYRGARSSAEWILEAPTNSFACGAGVDPWVVVGLCPMPPYSPVAFFQLGVTGHSARIWPIEMVQEGHSVSAPSELLGNAFGLIYTGPEAW